MYDQYIRLLSSHFLVIAYFICKTEGDWMAIFMKLGIRVDVCMLIKSPNGPKVVGPTA